MNIIIAIIIILIINITNHSQLFTTVKLQNFKKKKNLIIFSNINNNVNNLIMKTLLIC